MIIRLVLLFVFLIILVNGTVPTDVNLLAYSMVGMRNGQVGTEIWFDTNLDGQADIYSIFGFVGGKLVELDGAREYIVQK